MENKHGACLAATASTVNKIGHHSLRWQPMHVTRQYIKANRKAHVMVFSSCHQNPKNHKVNHQWESMHVLSHGIAHLWDLHCQQWEFHTLDKAPNSRFSTGQSFTDGVRRAWAPTSPGCFCWAMQNHANVNQHATVKLIPPLLNYTISQLSRAPITGSSAQHLHAFHSALACLSPFSS